MTTGEELPCPKCGRKLDSTAWHDGGRGQCRNCRVDFEFTGFPALNARRAVAEPKAVLVTEHATCFNHPENEAEAVCEGCGRFLCSVCAIPFAGRLVCPACIEAGTKADGGAVRSRILVGGIATSMAIVPLLFFPFTLVTAPVSLGFVIHAWRKPQSLVDPSRTRLVVAGLVAALEIVGWILFFTFLWLQKKR